MTDVEETTEQNIESEQVVYELGYHLLPTLSEDNIKTEVIDIKSSIEKCEGVSIYEELPKQVRLAYTMVKKSGSKHVKFDTAFFGWIKFEMIPEQAVALKEAMDKKDKVLRFIIIKTVRENTPLQQPKPKVYTKPTSEVKAPIKVAIKDDTKVRSPISDEELDKTIDKLVSKEN